MKYYRIVNKTEKNCKKNPVEKVFLLYSVQAGKTKLRFWEEYKSIEEAEKIAKRKEKSSKENGLYYKTEAILRNFVKNPKCNFEILKEAQRILQENNIASKILKKTCELEVPSLRNLDELDWDHKDFEIEFILNKHGLAHGTKRLGTSRISIYYEEYAYDY